MEKEIGFMGCPPESAEEEKEELVKTIYALRKHVILGNFTVIIN